MTPVTMTCQAATIVQHCAVLGRLVRRVRAYRIDAATPYAQYPVSVLVAFLEPRKRRRWAFRVVPDNLRYLTIEVDGQVLYDSRVDVPCDMSLWAATDRRFHEDATRRKAAYVPQPGVRTSFRDPNPLLDEH